MRPSTRTMEVQADPTSGQGQQGSEAHEGARGLAPWCEDRTTDPRAERTARRELDLPKLDLARLACMGLTKRVMTVNGCRFNDALTKEALVDLSVSSGGNSPRSKCPWCKAPIWRT